MAAGRSGRSGNLTLHKVCTPVPLGGETSTPMVLGRTSLQQNPLLPQHIQRQGGKVWNSTEGMRGQSQSQHLPETV